MKPITNRRVVFVILILSAVAAVSWYAASIADRSGNNPAKEPVYETADFGKTAPKEFPAELVAPKDAEELINNKVVYPDGRTTYSQTFFSGQSVNKLADYYENILSKNGWKPLRDFMEEGSKDIILFGQKTPNSLTATIVRTETGKTRVLISFSFSETK